MEINETGFNGLIIIQPKVFADSRGYFFESYNLKLFLRQEFHLTLFRIMNPNQQKASSGDCIISWNPFAQAKLIRVVIGKIYDVAVDLRKSSKTFGKWYGIELDSENKTQFFIPKGFAHGFSVLSEIAIIQYKCDNLYNSQFERGISLNDPDLGIDWKLADVTPIISEKDLRHPTLKEAENNF